MIEPETPFPYRGGRFLFLEGRRRQTFERSSVNFIKEIEPATRVRYSPNIDEKPRRLPLLLTGMSARLLLLTMFFVMLSEVFIYAPSIGRYRIAYMEERLAAAHLASLALEAPDDNRVSSELLEELLKSAKS